MEDSRLDDDPVQVYLSEVCGAAPLTEDHEFELVRRMLGGEEDAGKSLVEVNLAMVVDTARRYSRGNVHVMDLVVRGNEGLLFALKTFREHSDQRFSAYAAMCVEI